MLKEIREDINCKGKGCMSIWKRVIAPEKEKDGELRLFLSDCIENVSFYVQAYYLPEAKKSSLLRETYLKNVKRHISHLCEYLETGNVIGCPRRGF